MSDYISKLKNKKESFSWQNKFAFGVLCAIFCMILPCFGETYVFGGKNGWSEVGVRNGITVGKGRFGYESLELSTNANSVDSFSDLLLDFDSPTLRDTAGKYTVVENSTFFSKKAVMGKGAALSRRRGNGIVLLGDETSLFSCEGPAGSFAIDFWICPSTVENGEILLNWRSSRNIAGDIVYQLITMSFYKNKCMVLFSNIFDGYTQNHGDVTLISERSIIPGKWSHHVVSFEEETGCLEYRINGVLESILYLTDTGHEAGTVYPAIMGVAANLELCPQFTGLIDDFKISRSYFGLSAPDFGEATEFQDKPTYRINGGRFESSPVMLKTGTVLKAVTSEIYCPPQTDVKIYIRGGENHLNWTSTYPEWHVVSDGQNIQGLSGTYFQIAGELFPDGAGSKTPAVTQISVEYEPLPEVQPPYHITAKQGDRSVTLTWAHSVDETVGGYYIYYGNRPGEYLGRIAAEGTSPIDVGNVTSYTVSGLTNGTMYYFALCAYSKIDNRVCGALSKEVYARPEKLRN